MVELARAERAARRVLLASGEVTPPISVENVVRYLKLKLVYHDLDGDLSGMLVRKEDDSIIVVNVRHHANRQRFTIAHECGHFVLHQKQPTIFVDNLLVHFRAPPSTDADPREAAANRFAAAILMPSESLKADIRAQPIDIADDSAVLRLSRRYRVSAQALTVRLMSLGLVSGTA